MSKLSNEQRDYILGAQDVAACPCGSPGVYDARERRCQLELVELEAQDDGRQYSFRGRLCAEHANQMRAYWQKRFSS